jgi:hemerythrin-like domain-containing protein
MIEHRLIERMIDLAESEAGRIDNGAEVDTAFARSMVDFMRTYADRTHHGKEEDILFRVLAELDLSDEDRGLMEELIDEHARARSLVGSLEAAAGEAARGGKNAPVGVVGALTGISRLYPQHITKEDERFFLAAMEYLSDERKETMLEEFADFDREMIHERYRKTVEAMEEDRTG